MIKAVIRLVLFNIPFFLISAVFLYLGLTAEEGALIDDGTLYLKTFYFLMGGGFLGITLIVMFFLLGLALAKKRRIENIIAHGKQGTAKILKLEDTGVTINDNPRVRMLLEISIPNYPTYRTQKTVVIPIINLAQVQPDATVAVLADPEQPTNENRIGLLLK